MRLVSAQVVGAIGALGHDEFMVQVLAGLMEAEPAILDPTVQLGVLIGMLIFFRGTEIQAPALSTWEGIANSLCHVPAPFRPIGHSMRAIWTDP
jgi:hypothetical protein